MFKGVLTALMTPFKNGEIDFESLDRLVQNQLQEGIQGFVVCGTTAESATLTPEEQLKILDFVCKKVDQKVPILFGSGSNNTAKTIQWSRQACEYPIDALLVVVPYYNKPPQPGMVAHFKAVADAVAKPVVLYNVPGRTGAALEPESILELATHPNIVGIKEANDDLNNFSKYKSRVPDEFSLLSGDDGSCINFCFLGGHGVISVCSHIAPKKMVEWVRRAANRDKSVKEEFRQQLRWIDSLYISSNPIPTKYALMRKGLIASDEVRLPLVPMSSELKERQELAFKDFKGLL
jgi:4-hydroxy-tetrahydrodipicolinate synthase